MCGYLSDSSSICGSISSNISSDISTVVPAMRETLIDGGLGNTLWQALNDSSTVLTNHRTYTLTGSLVHGITTQSWEDFGSAVSLCVAQDFGGGY